MKTAPKKGAGRKPKSTEEAIDSIVTQAREVAKFVKLGMTMTDASRAAGINPRTLYSWLEKAKLGKPGYAQVEDILEVSRAQGQAVLAQRIAKASESDWRAAGWILERRHPETWGKQMDVNLSGGLDVNVGKLSDDEVDAELAKAEAELKEIEG